MANYDFYQNKACEYYPCHSSANPDSFSCLFCYCPLYALAENCGGKFTYTEQGIKDCSNCLIPHRRENYNKIMEKIPLVMELAKKKPDGNDG